MLLVSLVVGAGGPVLLVRGRVPFSNYSNEEGAGVVSTSAIHPCLSSPKSKHKGAIIPKGINVSTTKASGPPSWARWKEKQILSVVPHHPKDVSCAPLGI